MPIIKDKYKAKKTRTTPIIARNAKVDSTTTDSFSGNLNTGQLQSIATQDARNNLNVVGTGDIISTTSNGPTILGRINGYNLVVNDVVENIFTLNSNEKLKNITINYQHKYSTASVVSLFWSIYPASEISVVAADGVLTTIDSKIHRLLSTTFESNTNVNLQDLCHGFENLGKNVYFYGLASQADALGVSYTFLVG